MANRIRIKRSSTPGAIPTSADLASGELAINLNDRKLYSKNDLGAIIEIGAGGGGGGGASLWTAPSDSPPPTTDYLWWNTDLGRLFIYYSDGDSAQWVDASPAVQGEQGEIGEKGDVGDKGEKGDVGPADEENAIIFAIALG